METTSSGASRANCTEQTREDEMSGRTKLLCATAHSSFVRPDISSSLVCSVQLAQSVIKIGVSGAATGPASPNYAPNIEAFRMYVRTINDRGGINGSKIEL